MADLITNDMVTTKQVEDSDYCPSDITVTILL